MPSCTDPLKLNDNNLFKVLKNDLPKNIKDTRNLLEVRDDLYVWNPEKCCIFTLNISATREKTGEAVSYQTLQPTDPPIFEITNLVINETATQLALWGNLGIVLVELPRRWGKDNAFQGGKDVISCVNHNLSGTSSQLSSSEICQVRWHPGSSNDSHLLVLTSDNTFQLYECEIGNVPELVKTWKVGPTPHLALKDRIPIMESLGETAVDFDFITPSIRIDGSEKEIYDWDKIEWSILVLKGDGNVLIVRGNGLSETKSKPVVMGSLSIFPAADDNYGSDFCSIMCIQTTPPVVVIATCTGVIYHTILLEDTEGDSKKHDWSERGSNYSLHVPEEALYVIESVELELGLLFTDDDKKFSCSIKLHRDKENKSRYFCSHNAGIHMVSLPLIGQLEEFLNCKTENVNLHTPDNFSASNSQYLVCTRTKHTSVNDSTPVLGFGLFQQPCSVLIALLHSGIVVDFSVVDLDYIPRLEPPENITNLGNSTNFNKKVTREPFDVYVRNLLKSDSTSQPITKLNPQQKLSGKEYLLLLDRATTIFRTNHFVRHDKVRNAIDKKVRNLKAVKAYQLKELSSLMSTKEELQRKAQQLAERYEDIKEQQEKLAGSAEKVLRLVNYKELSSAERADAAELKELNDKVQDLNVRLKQLKKNDANQQTRMELRKKNEQKKELILNLKQESAIKSNISQMSQDIAMMISKVKVLEEELNRKSKTFST